MANWYIVVRTPTDGIHLYPIGDYQALGEDETQRQLAAARALHGVPGDWADHSDDGWSVELIDNVPRNGPLSTATRRDAPPAPPADPGT